MAVFPTSADMRRPVPRADGAGNYRPAAAALQGLEGAESLNQAGQQNQQIGAGLLSLGEQIDVSVAQEAVNEIRAKRLELTSDPEHGFRAIKGGDVLKPGPSGKSLLVELPDRLKAQADEIAAKLISPRAKAIFRSAALKETEGFKRSLLDHMDAQTEAFKAQAFKSAQAGFQNGAAQAETLSEIEGFADQAYQSTLTRAAVLGIDGEEMAKGARSDVLKIALTRRIQLGDESAIGMFDRWKGKLDAKDLLTIESSIKTMRIGVTARGQAADMLSGIPTTAAAEAGTKQSLKFWTDDGYSKQVAAGITAGFLRESQFSPAAVNPKDGRDGSDSVHVGQWNGARAKALQAFVRQNNLDPNDVNTGLKYAKAEIDGVIPYAVSGLSPAFKARLQNAKSEKEAADIMTRGYFRPLYQDGESAHRQKSASQILAKYGEVDPLQVAVDTASGVQPPKDGPQYMDTRQMLLDADTAYDTATRRNQEVNAQNEAQRRATQSQLDLNLAAQKRQIEMARLNLEIAVDKWMTTGGPGGMAAVQRPPPEIWNQLSYTKQQSIDATIAHNAKGQDVVTDQRVWYEIQQGLTSPDQAVRAQWANKPLWEFKRFLSNGDFQELSKIQATARQGDPNKQLTRILNANQMIDDTLLTLGVGIGNTASKGDAEKANNFRRLAQQQITAFEVEQKRPATPEEQRKIIDRLAMPTFLRKGMLWGEDTKPAYEITITDIPATEREKIVEALRGRGLPVTDDAIVDLYRRANARPKK